MTGSSPPRRRHRKARQISLFLRGPVDRTESAIAAQNGGVRGAVEQAEALLPERDGSAKSVQRADQGWVRTCRPLAEGVPG